MLKAHGLRTHIWNNNLRSTLLLIAFPLLLLLMAFGFILAFQGFTSRGGVEAGLSSAIAASPQQPLSRLASQEAGSALPSLPIKAS